MQKIINRLIDESVVNVDKYVNNGSTWLIFTESKQWVIELTKDGTLWYNYNFFKNLFTYMSMDVVENQKYITKWVEDNIINGVKQTRLFRKMKSSVVEDTLKNGVKVTYSGGDVCRNDSIEDTIQDGLKQTLYWQNERYEHVENTIDNGVRETKSEKATREWKSEQVIENGVKETHRFGLGNEAEIEDAIVNGVKDTKFSIFMNSTCVKDTIQNGVKETKLGAPDNRDYFIEDTIKNGIRHVEIGWAQYNNVEDVIKGGVKETKAMEEWVNTESIVDKTMKDGVKSTKPGGYLGSIEMKGKIVYQFESPKQNNEVEDVIENGIKKTEAAALFDEESTINTVISNGIKKTMKAFSSRLPNPVEGVVKNGVKETHDDVYHHTSRIEGVIRNGIKEVQPLPAQDGNRDWGNYYHRQKDRTKPHTQYVNDVIEKGNKLN